MMNWGFMLLCKKNILDQSKVLYQYQFENTTETKNQRLKMQIVQRHTKCILHEVQVWVSDAVKLVEMVNFLKSSVLKRKH